MDAFVIRATLVPAFMRLAGEVNWWAPAPDAAAVYERYRHRGARPGPRAAATSASDGGTGRGPDQVPASNRVRVT